MTGVGPSEAPEAPSIAGKVFRQGSVYTLSRVATYGAAFALIPFYTRIVGQEGYGLIELMTSVSMFLAFVFAQGLDGAWSRLRYDTDGPDGLEVFESSILWYLMLSGVVFVGLVTVVGPQLSAMVTPGVPYYPYGFLAVSAAALWVFVRLFELRLQLDERPGAFAAFTAVRIGLTVGFTVLLIAGFERAARGKLEADLAAAAILAVAAFVMLRPAAPSRVSLASLRQSLAYGLPLVPHGIASFLNNMIDRVLINAFIGLGATGLYSIGFQVGYVGAVLAIAFNQAYTPQFISTYKRAEELSEAGDEQGAARALESLAAATLKTVTAVSAVALIVTALGRELIAVLVPASYAEAWRVVAPIAAGSIAWACYFPFSQSAAYRTSGVRRLPLISGAAAAANVVGNLMLIPVVGIMGAAVATFGSNVLQAALCYPLAQRTAPIPYAWGRWSAVLITAAAGLAGFWFLDGSGAPQLSRLGAKLVLLTVALWVLLRNSASRPPSRRGAV